MKKLLAKLAAYALISLALSGILMNGAFAATKIPAEELQKLNSALDEVIKAPCIDTASTAYKDKMVTIIEEPLDIRTGTTDGTGKIGATAEGGPILEYKNCYKHTFQYSILDTEKSETHTIPALSEMKCSEATVAKDLAAKYKNNAQINVRYSCKTVQALISKGGTSLIYGYIGMIYRWAAGIVGIIAVLVIILSGIQLSASGGDSEATTAAKNRIIQSLAGIAVLFLSGLILYTINPNFFVY